MNRKYEMSVNSDENFYRLFVEIKFEGKDVGVIVTQEEDGGEFCVSVFSFIDRARERFFNSEKIKGISIENDLFLEAIQSARERLVLLDSPRDR